MIEKTCRVCGHTAMVESAMEPCPSCDRVYLKTDAADEKRIAAARGRQARKKVEPVSAAPAKSRERISRAPSDGMWAGFKAWVRPSPAPATPLSMADLTFGRVFFLALKFFIAWTVISWAFKAVMLMFALAGLSSVLSGMGLK